MNVNIVDAWDQLIGRLSGPGAFRFVLQPIVSVTLAIRAGLRDAQCGDPPFLWTVMTADARRRRTLLGECWRDVSMLFSVAAAIDCVYQIFVLRYLYPLQAVIVACALAIVPYVLIRGVAARIATRYGHRVRP